MDVAVRVRYGETDQMGIAYHPSYFVWFEIGRTELLRQRGLAYRAMEEEDGCFVVVTSASCDYRAPARYDDELTVRTRVSSANSRRIAFAYEILAQDGRVLATGATSHVITDRGGRPRRLPERYLRALAPSAR